MADTTHPQQWQYKIIMLTHNDSGAWYVSHDDTLSISENIPGTKPTPVLNFINDLGMKGWELVAAYSTTPREGAFPTNPTLLFKKPQ